MCRVGAVLSASDKLRCHRIGQAIAEHCRQRAHEALAAQDGRPAMLVYICDSWSAKVRGDYRKQVGDHVVRREGRFRHEFLLERGMLRFLLPDHTEDVHMIYSASLGACVWAKRRSMC